MTYLIYGIVIFFIIIILFVFIIIALFMLDPHTKYMKYAEEELSEILEESIHKNNKKKSKEVYEEMDMRDCKNRESIEIMKMYLKKYDS